MKIQAVTSTMVTAALVCLLAFGGGAIEAKAEESAGNNLSYPAILINGATILPSFTVTNEGLGTTYSYGCEGSEMYEEFTYPNTSCVNNLANPTIYYTAAECTAPGGKCFGKSVSRLYWQKEEDNKWSSQVTGVPLTGSAPVNVRYVDWGDSIEVLSWNDYSILRVETQPFVDLSQDSLPEVISATADTQTGFQMWHVSGQGITEQWGARVEEVAGDPQPVRGQPYVYQSPYAIINAGTADLYLTKLFPYDDDYPDEKCPDVGGGVAPVYPADYPFQRTWTAGTGWSDSCNLPIVPYTLEQSVSGKFVHGYNWRVRDYTDPLSPSVCGDPSWHRTGWWRLTYAPNGGASKMSFNTNTVKSAPAIPPAIPTALSTFLPLSEESDEVETTLYTPVVDVANNVTYIDICIVAKNDIDPGEYYVHPSVNVTGSGTISPSAPQPVVKNETVSFVLEPADGYYLGGITGTCPAGLPPRDNLDGTWSYTTGSIKSDCTVIANFFGYQDVSLTVTTVGSGTVSSSPSGIDCGADCIEDYEANTEVTLTATAAADFVFAGWSGDCSGAGTVTKVTVDTPKNCTATFTGLLYTITASASPTAGGGVICDPNPVLSGLPSTCTINTNQYYTLGTVTGTCGGTLDGSIYTTAAISTDCTVVANFVVEQFSLTVNTAGTGTGTVSSSPTGIDCGDDCSVNYDYNTEVTLTAIADAGSGFTGWSGDLDCLDGIVTMDAAKNCTATFTEGLYTITASASPTAGGEVNCDPNPVPDSSTSTCTIIPNPYYTLGTVTGTCPAGADPIDNGDGTWSYPTGEIESDCTVVANFVAVQFSLTVTFDGAGIGTVSSTPEGIDCPDDCSVDYDYNTEVTLTAIADAGSGFTGWSGNADCSDGIVIMDAAKSCTATFTKLLYTITASASPAAGGGVICENPVLYDSISNCTISTNQFYTLDTVTGTCPAGAPPSDNGDGTWDYTTGSIESDCTVVANFVLDRFSLTVSLEGTGTGMVSSSPEEGIDCPGDCSADYDYNTVVTLTATADAGSAFTGWSGDDADCSDGIVTMDAAKSCIATFEVGYLITASASPAEGGGVNCIPNPVLSGSNSTCTISTNPYYTLDTVTSSCGGELDGSIYTTTAITADCTVVANFVIDQFSLMVNTIGTGTGTVTSSPSGIDCPGVCSEDYDYNKVVTLTAIADAGSGFTGWSGNDDCSDGIVTMDAPKSCTATFTMGYYTITASASPVSGGGVSCEPNPVVFGSNSTCIISTNPHYTLNSVTGTCGGTLGGSIYTTAAISADCTVIATFEGGFPWSIFLPAILNQKQRE
ncbi:MAG: InlB B-repeat-containing protein [Desulfocapsaceae bacterium]|nr:InlB B-repeat-containing protein [Desulfocapsaceae bacterium]